MDMKNEVAHAVTVESVRMQLQIARSRGSRVGAVLIVSPTYFGAVSDVTGRAAFLHSLTIVDLGGVDETDDFRYCQRVSCFWCALDRG